MMTYRMQKEKPGEERKMSDNYLLVLSEVFFAAGCLPTGPAYGLLT
jgi:hypothetical protein